MSTNQKTWTDGEAITTTESNRVARIAAGMDDRAWEALLTPGSLQKRILPLSEETSSLNPRLLVVPGVTAGAVKLQPSLLLAGGVSLPIHLNMAAKIEAAIDSAIFGANSSGSNRYDLVYATISYAVSATGSRKMKDVVTGATSTQVLNLEKAPQVVVTVLPNVSNVTPTSGMPADPGDGSAYSFPLCYVTLPNGYTASTPVTQSQITQLWNGGWVSPHRVNGMRPLGLYSLAPTEKPAGAFPSSRWGSDQKFFGHFRLLSTTSAVGGSGPIVDSSIDWRHRHVFFFIHYLGSGTQSAFDSSSGVVSSTSTMVAMFSGAGGSTIALWTYSGSAQLGLNIDASGALRVNKGAAAVIDATNGDLFAVHVWASDQFVAGM